MKIPKHVTERLLDSANAHYGYEPAPIRVRIKHGKQTACLLVEHSIPEIVAKAIVGKTVWGLRTTGQHVQVFPNSQIGYYGFRAWWLPAGTFSVVSQRKKRKTK